MDETQQKALELVNRYRVKRDLIPLTEFPKGKIGNRLHCPLANALGAGHAVHIGILEIASPAEAEVASELLEKELCDTAAPTMRIFRKSQFLSIPLVWGQFAMKTDSRAYPELLVD